MARKTSLPQSFFIQGTISFRFQAIYAVFIKLSLLYQIRIYKSLFGRNQYM